MENIKLFRKKIPFEKMQNYQSKPTDTHLIVVTCEDNGNVFSTSSHPISSGELKQVYQNCITALVGEIQNFKSLINNNEKNTITHSFINWLF